MLWLSDRALARVQRRFDVESDALVLISRAKGGVYRVVFRWAPSQAVQYRVFTLRFDGTLWYRPEPGVEPVQVAEGVKSRRDVTRAVLPLVFPNRFGVAVEGVTQEEVLSFYREHGLPAYEKRTRAHKVASGAGGSGAGGSGAGGGRVG